MWFYFISGLMIGVLLAAIVYITVIHGCEGTLRIDHSNPEKDIYRFEVDNLDDLSKKKHIVLKVDNNAFLSQE